MYEYVVNEMTSIEEILSLASKTYKGKKLLFIFINDNISPDDNFFFPERISNISPYANYVKSIPTKYDPLIIKMGRVEHTFEIYNDLQYDNVFYLVQKHPLDIIPLDEKKTFVMRKLINNNLVETGHIIQPEYDYDILTYKIFLDVAKELYSQIKDEFDYYIFIRFSFDDIEESVAVGLYSTDMSSIFIDTFPDFEVERPTTKLHFLYDNEEYVMVSPYLSLILFMLLPNSKVYYDITIAEKLLYDYVDEEYVQVIKYEDYLNKIMDNIISTFLPSDVQ